MDTHAHLTSLAQEVAALKDRVQNMIGKGHWPTVGGWKETVLRAILRRHLPASLQVGSGFVLSPLWQSSQIDILIYEESGPILFREGDLVVITPEVVRGVIEVKTRVKKHDLKEVFAIIHQNAIKVRSHPNPPVDPFFGLFAYENEGTQPDDILEILREENSGFGKYPINCISLGVEKFVRFWPFAPTDPTQQYRKWHCYQLDGLSHAYFIQNVIDHLFPNSIVNNNELWFPPNSKENYIVAQRERLESI